MTTAGIYSAPAARVADPVSGGYSQINIWSPKGRLGRVRYIAYSIGFGVLFNMASAAVTALGGKSLGPVLFAVTLIAGGVIHALLSIQRAHDIDWTGWLAILAFIPLLNLIFWFVPGTGGENRFGKQTPPNGIGVIIAAWIIPIVMIVGILAAVAIPAYQNYAERTQSSSPQ
jgi:uncharacterized membrane protein YhaH (DUF805 family)